MMIQKVLNTNTLNKQNPQLTMGESSNTIKYEDFSSLSTKVPIWIPESNKSIYLTGAQVTAPLPISINLSDGEDTFLSFRISEPFSTMSQRFFSPFKLASNNALMVSTSDEENSCNIFGSVSASQVDYNGRSDFSNVSNTIGLANGSVASLASGLLTQSRGRIILGYNMLPSEYNYFQIEKVLIKYYCRLSLTVAVGVSSMILYWRSNPQTGWIQLQEVSLALIGTIDNLTTPIVHDITDTVLGLSNPWEVINSLQTSFVGIHTGLGLGNTVQLDAIEVELCMVGKNKITVFGYEG